MKAADRLGTVEEYYFSKKLKEVQKLRLQGNDILNLGIGSPDLIPPNEVIADMRENALSIEANKYQSYIGISELREAIAKFYNKWYKVTLNPENEILPLMGSKEGILHISMAFLNKGDKVLIPNPGYPTYTSVTKLVEATPIFYDLLEKHNYQPDWALLEKLDLRSVKLMWVNYPHMPTGAIAENDTFSRLNEFGKKHDILIVNDNPYSFVLNDNPKSLLSTDKEMTHLLELNSLSKTFNMAGWRIGMLCGNSECIEHVLRVKSNMDSGMYYPLQKGAITALGTHKKWLSEQNATYKIRKEYAHQLMGKMGCTYQSNTSGMFVWGKLPNGVSSEDFIDEMLYIKNIFVTPGTIFGSNGEGYVRVSLCLEKELIQRALDRL